MELTSHALDQVVVWITAINAFQFPSGARSINNLATLEYLNTNVSHISYHHTLRTVSNLNASGFPTRLDLLDGMVGNETQIFTSRLDLAGLGLELGAGLMQIQFLLAEYEGMAFAAFGHEPFVFHAEAGGVEFDGVGDGFD